MNKQGKWAWNEGNTEIELHATSTSSEEWKFLLSISDYRHKQRQKNKIFYVSYLIGYPIEPVMPDKWHDK